MPDFCKMCKRYTDLYTTACLHCKNLNNFEPNKSVLIMCDYATQQRIKDTFAFESERCFFGNNKSVQCKPYKMRIHDSPDCSKCIEENVEWIITDDIGWS